MSTKTTLVSSRRAMSRPRYSRQRDLSCFDERLRVWRGGWVIRIIIYRMDVPLTSIRIVAAAGSDAAAVSKAVCDAVRRLEFLPETSVHECRSAGPFGPGTAYELLISAPEFWGDIVIAVRAAVLWEIEAELRRRHLAVPYVENQPRSWPLVLGDTADGITGSNDAANEIRQYLARNGGDRPAGKRA